MQIYIYLCKFSIVVNSRNENNIISKNLEAKLSSLISLLQKVPINHFLLRTQKIIILTRSEVKEKPESPTQDLLWQSDNLLWRKVNIFIFVERKINVESIKTKLNYFGKKNQSVGQAWRLDDGSTDGRTSKSMNQFTVNKH